MQRFVLWRGIDSWRAEAAVVDLTGDEIRAAGSQLGVDPVPYRLDYELEARERFVTRVLRVSAQGEGWVRRIVLRHDGRGAWNCEVEAEGRTELPSPGGDTDALAPWIAISDARR